jgi:hypothetical protein
MDDPIDEIVAARTQLLVWISSDTVITANMASTCSRYLDLELEQYEANKLYTEELRDKIWEGK